MWCRSRIRCHGCLAVRQPPDASHVSLSQAVWWRFRWQVDSIRWEWAQHFLKCFFFFLLLWWRPKLITVAPNPNTVWSSHLWIRRIKKESRFNLPSCRQNSICTCSSQWVHKYFHQHWIDCKWSVNIFKKSNMLFLLHISIPENRVSQVWKLP